MSQLSSEINQLFAENKVKELRVYYVKKDLLTRAAIRPESLKSTATDTVTKIRPAANDPLVRSFLDSLKTEPAKAPDTLADIRFGLLLIGQNDETLFALYSQNTGEVSQINNVWRQRSYAVSRWIVSTIKRLFQE